MTSSRRELLLGAGLMSSAALAGQAPGPADLDPLLGQSRRAAAPLGTGAIYIRRERMGDIAPFLGNKIHDEDDVRARVLTGTINYAAHLSIPTAIAVHRRIGVERKLRHLQRLRDYWVSQVRDVPGLTFQLPERPRG